VPGGLTAAVPTASPAQSLITDLLQPGAMNSYAHAAARAAMLDNGYRAA
jgi:hypothetical protein